VERPCGRFHVHGRTLSSSGTGGDPGTCPPGVHEGGAGPSGRRGCDRAVRCPVRNPARGSRDLRAAALPLLRRQRRVARQHRSRHGSGLAIASVDRHPGRSGDVERARVARGGSPPPRLSLRAGHCFHRRRGAVDRHRERGALPVRRRHLAELARRTPHAPIQRPLFVGGPGRTGGAVGRQLRRRPGPPAADHGRRRVGDHRLGRGRRSAEYGDLGPSRRARPRGNHRVGRHRGRGGPPRPRSQAIGQWRPAAE
jgi:hypothetical protein